MAEPNLENIQPLQSIKIFRTLSGSSLPKHKINSILSSAVDRSSGRVGARILRREHVADGAVRGHFSIARFYTWKKPGFMLVEKDDEFDQHQGYCLVYERGGYVFVFGEKLSWDTGVMTEVAERLSRGEMARYAGAGAQAHHRIALKSLDPADRNVRAQVIEGTDLGSTYSPLGMNRQVLTAIGVRKSAAPDARITLSQSAVRSPGGRLTFEGWCNWASYVADDLERSAQAPDDQFINLFARPLDLRDLPPTVRPTGVFVWIDTLGSETDLGNVEFFWQPRVGGPRIRIRSDRALDVIDYCRDPIPVAPDDDETSLLQDGGPVKGLSLRRNQSSFGLSGGWLNRVHVTDSERGSDETLSVWLRRERALHVLFSDICYAYSENTLFEDASVRSLVPAVCRMVRPDPLIGERLAEKGGTTNATILTGTNLFSVIERRLGQSDFLICEDGAPEWADYIAVDNTGSRRRITLVHAKAGEGKMAPAQFEQVVSQAVKNLSQFFASDPAIRSKQEKWREVLGTQPRLRKGSSVEDAANAYIGVKNRYDGERKVILVVTFLSKSAVDKLASKVESGEEMTSSEVLLAWLLTGFRSSCMRSNAVPEIWCSP